MATIQTNLTCELQNGSVAVQYLNGVLFSQDNQANQINVAVYDGGEPATISGTVTANIIRADGGTVTATGGSISGNVASIAMPSAAYAVPGVASIIVKLSTSGVVTTLAAFVTNIYESSTSTAIDPGTIIPSVTALVAQIDTAVASIPADYSTLWTTLAPAFSTSTTYAAGQYVTYNGGLYRFTAAHTGNWSASDVVAANIGNDLSSLKSTFELSEYDPSLSFSEGFVNGQTGVITTTSTAWQYATLELGFLKKIAIQALGNGSTIGFAFYDDSNNFISDSGISYSNKSETYLIIAPVNAKYIKVSKYNSDTNFAMGFIDNVGDVLPVLGTKAEITALQTQITNINKKDQYSPTLTYVPGYYKATDGTYTETSASWERAYIPVGKFISAQVYAIGGASHQGICFYDANNTFISGSGVEYENSVYSLKNVSIPNNAVYVGITKKIADTDFQFYFTNLPKASIEMIKDCTPVDHFNMRVMTFNVGKYSYGTDWSGTDKPGMPESEYQTHIRAYKEFFSRNNCDIIGLQEARKFFDQDNTHEADVVLYDYLFRDKINYNLQTAIKSNFTLYDAAIKTLVNGDRTYAEAKIQINGQEIYIGNFHLTAGADQSALRALQWAEVIDIIEQYEYWIIFGDFNAQEISDYNVLSNIPHNMANGGLLGTYPSSQVDHPTDNIITSENILIKNSQMLSDWYSQLTSDHKAIMAELTILLG